MNEKNDEGAGARSRCLRCGGPWPWSPGRPSCPSCGGPWTPWVEDLSTMRDEERQRLKADYDDGKWDRICHDCKGVIAPDFGCGLGAEWPWDRSRPSPSNAIVLCLKCSDRRLG